MKRILIALFTCAVLAGCGYGDNNGSDNAPNNDTGMNGAGGSGDESRGAGTGGDTGDSNMNESGAVIITRPPDGATISSKQPVELEYQVNKSSEGDHVHITVDDGKPDVVDQLSGAYEIAPLSAGDHTITVAEATSDHSPTGNQAVIHLKVE